MSIEKDARARLTGIALMCVAVMALSVLDATAKYLNQYMSTVEIVWARYLTGALIVFVFVNPKTQPGLLVTRRPLWQVLRGVILIASTLLNWLGLRELQLDEAVAIQFCGPFVIAALAGPLLGEWIDLRRWLAIAVGFLGVLVVLRPGFGTFNPAALYAVGSTICYALFAILTRLVVRQDSAHTTLFYTQLIGGGLMSFVVPFAWTTPDQVIVLALLLFAGACGSVGQLLMIMAFRLAPAAVLAPFQYVQLLSAPILGLVIFGDLPNRWTVAGATIVVGAGLYLLYCETRYRSQGSLA